MASAEGVAASIVAELAREVLALKEWISPLDAQIEPRLRVHPLSGVLTSLPGMGALLGAEFLATVGDPRDVFASADQLAAFAGLAPAARDSGKRPGNDRRMRGGNRRLKEVFYQAAFANLRGSPESRALYDPSGTGPIGCGCIDMSAFSRRLGCWTTSRRMKASLMNKPTVSPQDLTPAAPWSIRLS